MDHGSLSILMKLFQPSVFMVHLSPSLLCLLCSCFLRLGNGDSKDFRFHYIAVQRLDTWRTFPWEPMWFHHSYEAISAYIIAIWITTCELFGAMTSKVDYLARFKLKKNFMESTIQCGLTWLTTFLLQRKHAA